MIYHTNLTCSLESSRFVFLHISMTVAVHGAVDVLDVYLYNYFDSYCYRTTYTYITNLLQIHKTHVDWLGKISSPPARV